MKTPKGIIVLIGGAEDRGRDVKTPAIAELSNDYLDEEILRFVVRQSTARKPRIEVVTTASSEPKEVGEMYQGIFHKLGHDNVGVLDLRDRAAANAPETLARLDAAHAIFFGGGDQFRLSTLLGGTRFNDRLFERYLNEPLVVAGTSAGAMAIPKTILYEGHCDEAMLRGDVKISAGLGLFDGCIVDTHFIKRGRFSRLAQAIITNPSCVGIGLGEDTALVIRRGHQAECIGSGMVVIIDGHQIGATNVADVPDGSPLCVEGLVVHALVRGCRFDLLKRQFALK
jgi:cyanophycinase